MNALQRSAVLMNLALMAMVACGGGGFQAGSSKDVEPTVSGVSFENPRTSPPAKKPEGSAADQIAAGSAETLKPDTETPLTESVKTKTEPFLITMPDSETLFAANNPLAEVSEEPAPSSTPQPSSNASTTKSTPTPAPTLAPTPAAQTPAPSSAPKMCTRLVTKQCSDGIGVKINSKNHSEDTQGQCNTSCHWAGKGFTACATNQCAAPGTVNDSLCTKCIYEKQVEEQFPCP